MVRPEDFGDDWDQDPHGVLPSEHLRPWQRRRNYYLTGGLGIVGFLLLLGALGFFSAARLAGALAVLGSCVAVWSADRAAATSRASERLWVLAATVLLAGGVLLYAVP